MKYLCSTTIFLSLLFIACNSSDNKRKNQSSDNVTFTRLDEIVAHFSVLPQERQFAIVDSLSLPLNDYIYLMGASTGNVSASIDSLSHTAAFAIFKPEVEKIFPTTTAIEKSLTTINANFSEHLPNLPKYSYYGIISPYRQQVMLVDSVVYVALNHYLGANHEAYSSMPEFIRTTKSQEYIPLDITEAIIAIEFPYVTDINPTVIQYLIYEGAKLKAVELITGISDISTLMGWNASQTSSVQSQETAIWRKMATDNLIYSTDYSLARRLCEPAPNSRAISPGLPGRVGRYIGYCIVCAYLDNNSGTTLSSILSPEFYNNPSTLIKSSYSPE